MIEDKENSFIIHPGINILQLESQQNYHINIIKSNDTDILIYSILRDHYSYFYEKNLFLKSNSIYFIRNLEDNIIRLRIENEKIYYFHYLLLPFMI